MLCINCQHPNEVDASSCIRCNAPIGAFSTTTPDEAIFSEGYLYRRMATGKANLTILIGVWLLFGPVPPAMAITVIAIAPHVIADRSFFTAGGFAAYLALLIMGGFYVVVSCVILSRVTKAYLNAKRNRESQVTDSDLTDTAAQQVAELCCLSWKWTIA